MLSISDYDIFLFVMSFSRLKAQSHFLWFQDVNRI